MRIFISHGTNKDDASDLAFLRALAVELATTEPGAPPHTVLLDDTRLKAGDDWPGILHDFLAECQAAVLVLSKRALTRPLVLKEATILSYRKAREKSAFPFYCVVMPDTSMAAVQALPAFNALGLDDQQAFVPGTPAAEVAAWVKTKLGDIEVRDVTPLDRLQNELANRIGLTQNTQALEQICEHWLGEPVEWFASTERGTQRARVIARAIARGDMGKLKSLTEMTRALRRVPLTNENCRDVLNLSASLWVEAVVAGQLGAVVAATLDPSTAGTAPLAVALNSDTFEHGLTMAVWRAQLPDIAGSVYPVAGGHADDRESALVDAIRLAFKTGRGRASWPDALVDKVLATREEPVFFLLPAPVPDGLLLLALRKQFPRAIFILCTGHELMPDDDVPVDVVQLAPGLDTVAEWRSLTDYDSAHELIL